MSQFDGDSTAITTVPQDEEPPDSPVPLPTKSLNTSRRRNVSFRVSYAPPHVAASRVTVSNRPAENDRPSSGTAKRPSGNPQTRAFRKAFFPEVSDQEWNDWRWQARNRFRSLEQLERILDLSDDERQALQKGGTLLPVSITPY